METTETRTEAAGVLTSRKLETFVCFAAMMLPITLEAACVYWLGVPGVLHRSAGNSLTVVGQWTSATLPQCWLLGALAVLLYRAVAMVVRPKTWDGVEILHNRRAFVQLWRWAVAVGAVQIGALCLDRVASAVH
jgi:hypothetical protein